MGSTLVRGKYIICSTTAEGDAEVIEDGAVFQKDGDIVDVGGYADLKARYRADEELGSSHHVVMPGLINSHHHVGLKMFQMGTRYLPLELIVVELMRQKQADRYWETLWCAMEMVESGITTVNHMNMWSWGGRRPGETNSDAMFGIVDQVLHAYDDSGMRVAFSQPMRDQNYLVYGDDAFLPTLPTELRQRAQGYLDAAKIPNEDWLNLHRRAFDEYGRNQAERVRVLICPTNLQWCSDSLLLESKEFAASRNTGIHIHLVETMYQKEYGLRTFGKTPLAHLYDLGFLGPEVSIDHGVWLTEGDIDILRETGTMLTLQPSSNLRLVSGIAPLNELLAKGITVGLGIDEAGINDDNDQLQEMRLAFNLNRVPGISRTLPKAAQIFHLATMGGAKTTLFADRIGSIEKGKGADLVLMDLRRMSEPYLEPGIPAVDLIVNRGKTVDIDTVMIAGEVVLKDRKFTRLNKEEVVAGLKESLVRDLTPQERDRRELSKDLMPHVQRFYEGWELAPGQPHSVYNSSA